MDVKTEIIRSDRKTTAVEVRPDRVIVRAPRTAGDSQIQSVLEKNKAWIEKTLERMQENRRAVGEVKKLSDEELRALAKRAAEVIPGRVEYYAGLLGVTCGRITIRCQRTKWGSCSSKGNLNFNCLLMLAPPEVLDSVVVHELCHLREMNHSKRFYAEIERVMPDYRRRYQWLRDHGAELMEMAAREE